MGRLFFLGAIGYPALELLYRRRTHYSMALAGGASAVLIGGISKIKGGILAKAILCGLGITGVEYLCGCLWNRNWQVWDYRRMPMNLQGQVCLPYTLLWCGMSAGLLLVLQRENRT